MKRKAIELGIPENALILDSYGYSTYDTCMNAVKNRSIEKIILVTQKYHLPRALFFCNQFGPKCFGIIADKTNYSPITKIKWCIREYLATTYGWIKVRFHS